MEGKKMFALNKRQVKYLATHIVFPYKLPQKAGENNEVLEIEKIFFSLCLQAIENIKSLEENLDNLKKLQSITRILSTWSKIQSSSLKSLGILKSLNKLPEESIFPIYMPSQNSCIFIQTYSKNSEYKASISIFQASMKNSDVMSKTSDLSYIYPEASWYIENYDMFRSETITDQIVFLANQEIAASGNISSKKGIKLNEIRDVRNCLFVKEWFCGAVNAGAPNCEQVCFVNKKIRDNVMWKDAYLSFRRNPLWTCIKAIMQICFNYYFQGKGNCFYKLFQCEIVFELCKISKDLKPDLKLQVIQKLAQRIHKFSLFSENDNFFNNRIGYYEEEIEKRRKELNSINDMIADSSRNKNAVINYNILTLKDCVIKNSELKRNILDFVNFENDSNNSLNSSMIKFKFIKIEDDFPSFDYYMYNEKAQLSIILYGTEMWIRSNLCDLSIENFIKTKIIKELESYVIKLYSLLENYQIKAISFYKADPVGMSRMILACINLICSIDKSACIITPLMNQFSLGIDNQVFKHLLLLNKDDINYAVKLEQYVKFRNNQEGPSLINSNGNSTKNSFHSKFYQSNNKCKELKKVIYNEANILCKYKMNEFMSLERTYKSNKETYNNLKCEYYWTSEGQYLHKYLCYKCNLSRTISEMSIEIYEWPLPTCAKCYLNNNDLFKEVIEKQSTISCGCRLKKRVVLSEILLPTSIVLLRDALHNFMEKVLCKYPNESINKAQKTCGQWIKYKPLLKDMIYQRNATLGSTSKLFMESHYKRINLSMIESARNVFTPNGYSVVFSCTDLQIQINYNFDIHFIIKVLSFELKKPYKELQYALSYTFHNENQVIANQEKCDQNLQINEFLKFGFFRAGGNLQLLNLLDAIETRGLALKNENIYMLFCQSLWQIGPIESNYYLFHLDFFNHNFMIQVHSTITNYIGLIRNKWEEQITLCNVITIVNRFLNMSYSKEIKDLYVELLYKCRELAMEWKLGIEQFIQEQKNSGIADKIDFLKSKLAEISYFGIMTYDIQADDMDLVLNNEKDVLYWLRFSCKINDLKESKEYFHNLIYSRAIQILMNVSSTIGKIISQNESILTKYSIEKWSSGIRGKFGTWKNYSNFYFSSTFSSVNTSMIIELSIDGIFVIQGKDVDSLPRSISSLELYRSYFENIFFDVQPDVHGLNSYITQEMKENEGSISYSFIKTPQKLIIEKHLNVNNRIQDYVLIPKEFLENHFPHHFIQDYSHWLDKQTSVIEFQAKSFKKRKKDCKVYHEFDVTKMILNEKQENKMLVYIKSPTFNCLYQNIFFRMDDDIHIHMWVSPNKHYAIEIQLHRYFLKFKANKNKKIIKSNEFRGFYVCESQKLNTFFGLEQGLVLSEAVHNPFLVPKKKFIVPHGEISNTKNPLHQKVCIDIDELRKPSFFTFDQDDLLRIYKTGESLLAWFYLALLHAKTSTILPDPFLSQTGTNRSLEILKSAYCWSISNFSDEAKCILKSIKDLSPKRNFYPNHLTVQESVVWPEGIPNLCSSDMFAVMSKTIKKNSRIIDFNKKKSEKPIVSQLAEREYRRLKKSPQELKTDYDEIIIENKLPTNMSTKYNEISDNMKITKMIMTCSYFPQELKLVEKFMRKQSTLNGASKKYEKIPKNIKWNSMIGSFKDKWLKLYVLALKISEEKHYNYCIMLSFLAFQLEDIDLILLLQVVLHNKSYFYQCLPPKHLKYTELLESDYIEGKVKNIIKCNLKYSKNEFANKFIPRNEDEMINTSNLLQNYNEQMIINRKNNEANERYKYRVEITYNAYETKLICNTEKMVWDNWNKLEFDMNFDIKEFKNNIKSDISKKLSIWYANKELREFFEKLESIYISNYHSFALPNKKIFEIYNLPIKNQFRIYNCVFDLKSNNANTISYENIQLKEDNTRIFKCYTKNSEENKFMLNETSSSISKCLIKELKESWDHYANNKTDDIEINYKACIEIFSGRKFVYENIIKGILAQLEKILKPEKYKYLQLSGLWPEVRPMVLLGYLMDHNNENILLNECTKKLIQTLAIYWIYWQRSVRCINYAILGKSSKVFLEKEIISAPQENWNADDHLEWLILQIEMDIMIRPIQVTVARKMINPDSGKNSVMQLNMGEGKTSVIIPMIVSALASKTCLIRIIVLRALFNMNYNSLVMKLGGVLNRRIYTFPCNRDNVYDESIVRKKLETLKECQRKKGVILTVPEHMLSFELKSIEKCKDKTISLGKLLVETTEWLDDNTRDILDESDELLNSKFQLVYSIGRQLSLNGGNLRWEVAQAVLSLAEKHYKSLQKKYGEDTIYYNDGGDLLAYPQIRLLNESANAKLCGKICKDILRGKSNEINFLELTKAEINKVKQYVLNNKISPEIRTYVENLFKTQSEHLTIILLIRGLLGYGILVNALSKRWRVEYGVNPQRNNLFQAVPYRAKDVPAERAQYEHPDMIIMLTQLSYYYSGLSSSQLDKVFNYLSNTNSGPQVYEKWIQHIPKSYKIDDSIREYIGLNFGDPDKIEKYLYPVMRKHPLVINFWLNMFLYPKELKQFQGKFSRSSWDISKKKKNLTTGFSGTNETKMLLPLNIKYDGIEELMSTNGSLINCLLLKENNGYECFNKDFNGEMILKKITEHESKINLILDVGALMIDLNNEEVALKWLKMREDMEAAIFFTRNHDLMCINRKGIAIDFELSTYRRHLDKCLIYLDDSHTRGTDLKMPIGTIGAVTLGKGVTKDRLIQACMRLRMLGKGHSVFFYSSDEVHHQICKIFPEVPENALGSLHVLQWAIENSSKFAENALLYWAMQGISFMKRQLIYKSFKRIRNYIFYNEKSTELQELDIKTLYSADREKQLLVKFIEEKGIQFHNTLLKINAITNSDKFKTPKIIDHLNIYGGSIENYTQMHDEEQEVELEIELEQMQEQKNKRPANLEPHKPEMPNEISELLIEGIFKMNPMIFLPMHFSLKNTSLDSINQLNAWSPNIYITKEFIKTVSKDVRGDDYLRPPKWVVSIIIDSKTYLIILSGFEINKYKNYLNDKINLIMLMPRLRKEQNNYFSLKGSGISEFLMQQLMIFSGSQYFRNDNEVDEYLKFIGYSPGPRNEYQQECFEKGMITMDGFILPEFRKIVLGIIDDEDNEDDEKCMFYKNPDELIIGLAEIRARGLMNKFAHHLIILRRGKRPSINS
ncbi:hypothetical protein SteCoe_11424 [Stentor coeruleus]|uniref:ubiquitinyl hydrolase 1 n=1 Tax=Stentor coeruleus TaxID=5963 RepID=A0A1R2CD69_9CILI|nr:hypothetical protein SteCoe_11424 [Stentor coeruleus]